MKIVPAGVEKFNEQKYSSGEILMTPKLKNTASIEQNKYCKDCGWPIIFACCNDEMGVLHPDEDWWMYCSNQGCKNHAGAPYGQSDIPKFLGRIK